jgi:F-type H+-transporting ATPase subunit delta
MSLIVTEVSKRYAKALFQSVGAGVDFTSVLSELREIEKAIFQNPEIAKFFESPLINSEEKSTLLKTALEKASVSETVKSLAVVMASRERMGEWSGLVQAFQLQADELNGVVRGTVRCARPLGPEQRQTVEARISQVTGKKVILEYKLDETLLGGLVAEVGSLTFDDSLETQLRLMNEDLKRRAH